MVGDLSNSGGQVESMQTPKLFLGVVVLICVGPFVLNLLGIDFASQKINLTGEELAELEGVQRTDAIFMPCAERSTIRSLSGVLFPRPPLLPCWRLCISDCRRMSSHL